MSEKSSKHKKNKFVINIQDVVKISQYTTLYFAIYVGMMFLFPLSRLLIIDYYSSTGIKYMILAISSTLAFGLLSALTTWFLEKRYWFLLQGKRKIYYYTLNVVFAVGSYYLMFNTNSFNIPSYIEMNSVIYSIMSVSLTGPIIPLASLVVINLTELFKDIRSGVYGSTGGLASVLSLGCPSCGALLFSLIGLPFALAFLPFKGLELKFLAILSLWYAVVHISTKCEGCDDKTSSELYKKAGYFVIANLLFIVLALNFAITQSIIYEDPNDIMLPANLGNIDVLQSTSTLMTLSLVFPELKKAQSQEEVIEIMLPKGTPSYAEHFQNAISFDKPLESLSFLARYYFQIKKEVKENNPDAWERYVKLASSPIGISCEFCCGVGPAGADKQGNLRCGCQHNPALQAIALGLLANTDMSDAEVVREVMKWKAMFFPRDMVGLGLRVSSGDIDNADNLPGMVGGC